VYWNFGIALGKMIFKKKVKKWKKK
jgi:hypothetical protein